MAGSANSPQSLNSDAAQSLSDTAVEKTNTHTHKQDALKDARLVSSSDSTLDSKLDEGLKLEIKNKLFGEAVNNSKTDASSSVWHDSDSYKYHGLQKATDICMIHQNHKKSDTNQSNEQREPDFSNAEQVVSSKSAYKKSDSTLGVPSVSKVRTSEQSDYSQSASSASEAITSEQSDSSQRSVWREIWSKRMGVCLVTGFASGMPLFVLINLLAAFLRKEGLDLKTIGVFSLIMFPYTWKFLWAPFVDRFSIFHLGRRKDWIILSQVMLIISIGMMGMFNPNESLWVVSVLSIVIAFSSATQDIVLDAYRREFLPDYELGLGNAIFVNAYRVAGLVPGGISLILADYVSWQVVFMFTAACLIPCLVLSFFLREQELTKAPRTLKDAVVEPFREFITRRGLGAALFIVCFVFLYKIGDSMALALATPFYMDLGYDLTTIGIVAKNVGLWSTVIGGLLGGVFMLKLGINRALWVFGVIQVVTILGFVLLAHLGQSGTPSIWILALVLIGEYGGGGLGTSAFVAFIAKETNPAYTATQLALLSSFSAVPRTFCNATTGYLVEGLGWENFFIFCTIIALPGMLLLFKVAPWRGEIKQAA